MDLLVPKKVSYDDFWMRYLFQKSRIDADESRRKQLFTSNKEEENEFDWDNDDEIEEGQQSKFVRDIPKASIETVKDTASKTGQSAETAPRNSSTSESTTSFDIVSQSSALTPMTKDVVLL